MRGPRGGLCRPALVSPPQPVSIRQKGYSSGTGPARTPETHHPEERERGWMGEEREKGVGEPREGGGGEGRGVCGCCSFLTSVSSKGAMRGVDETIESHVKTTFSTQNTVSDVELGFNFSL